MVSALTATELKELQIIVHRECAAALNRAKACCELREYAATISRIDAKLHNIVSAEYLKEGRGQVE